MQKILGEWVEKKPKVINVVKTALEIIYLETGKNPVELFIRAIENTAPNEDTTRIVYGGVVYHVSVDVSPLRRVDLALRFIAEGVRDVDLFLSSSNGRGIGKRNNFGI